MTVRIEGLAELERKLKQFPTKLQRRAVTAAMRAGAREIVKEVKARAPVDSGALKRNVGTKRGSKRFDRGLAGRQIVGVRHGKVRTTGKLTGYDKRGDDPFYYRFQEKGFTAVGRRKAASRAVRAVRRSGLGVYYGRKIQGKQYLAKGLAAAEPRALMAVRNRLALEVERLR